MKEKKKTTSGEKFYNMLILHADGKVIMHDKNLEKNKKDGKNILSKIKNN